MAMGTYSGRTHGERVDLPNLERWVGLGVTVLGGILVLGTAGVAVALAATGARLGVLVFSPWVALATTGSVGVVLGLTGFAVARLAQASRFRDLVFEGLVEEISQEFDKVTHRQDLLADALTGTDTRLARLKDVVRRMDREPERDTARAVAVRVEK